MLAFINANTVQSAGYHVTALKSIVNKSPDEPFGGVLANSNSTADDSDTSSAVTTSVTSQSSFAAASVLFTLFLVVKSVSL